MMKILETWICIEDLCWPVLFFQSITVNEGSSCLKLKFKDLGDSILVGVWFLVQLLQDLVMSGLYCQTILVCWNGEDKSVMGIGHVNQNDTKCNINAGQKIAMEQNWSEVAFSSLKKPDQKTMNKSETIIIIIIINFFLYSTALYSTFHTTCDNWDNRQLGQ